MDIVVGLQVTGQWVKSDGITFVSSSCNIYSCSFDFSEDWQEYTKTAVFRLNDGTSIETPISNNTCKIPWEALDNPGVLRIGVYGLSGQQPDLKRYPTVWSREIRVVEGVPGGDKVDIAQAAINFGLDVPDGSKINDYAEAILAYSQKSNKYIHSFSGTTTVSIPASNHGQVPPVIDVYILVGSTYVKTVGYQTDGYKVAVDSSGNITITFNAKTSGKVIIM